jgi:hypothetical protein
MVGNDKAEDRVTEELQALVGGFARSFRAPRAVSQGPGQQPRVEKRPSQASGDGGERGARRTGQEASSLATT